jgi:hypothetical protein
VRKVEAARGTRFGTAEYLCWMEVTKTDVANWMIEFIRARQGTDQGTIVAQLKLKYGHESEWLYKTDSGGYGIAADVRAEFKKLHGGTIKWDAPYRSWSNIPQFEPATDAEEA